MRATKKCNTCKRDLEISLYNKHPHGALGLRGSCRNCENIKRQNYIFNNEDARKRKIEWEREYRKSPEYARRKLGYRLKANYNMTLTEYDEICEKQGGVCAICGKPNKGGKRLRVDHNHDTDEVRGLLCDYCNIGIGCFFEDKTALSSAINYLNKE